MNEARFNLFIEAIIPNSDMFHSGWQTLFTKISELILMGVGNNSHIICQHFKKDIRYLESKGANSINTTKVCSSTWIITNKFHQKKPCRMSKGTVNARNFICFHFDCVSSRDRDGCYLLHKMFMFSDLYDS